MNKNKGNRLSLHEVDDKIKERNKKIEHILSQSRVFWGIYCFEKDKVNILNVK